MVCPWTFCGGTQAKQHLCGVVLHAASKHGTWVTAGDFPAFWKIVNLGEAKTQNHSQLNIKRHS